MDFKNYFIQLIKIICNIKNYTPPKKKNLTCQYIRNIPLYILYIYLVIETSPRSKSLLEQLKNLPSAQSPQDQQQLVSGMQQSAIQTSPLPNSSQQLPETEQAEDELNSSTDFFSFKKKDASRDQSADIQTGLLQSGQTQQTSLPQTGSLQMGMQPDFTTSVGIQSTQSKTLPLDSQQNQTGISSFPDMATGSLMSNAQQLQQQQLLQRQQQMKQQQLMKQVQRQQQMFQRQQQQFQQQLQQQLQQPLIPEAHVCTKYLKIILKV